MKVVLFGLGSIGQRHAALLREHGRHDIRAFRSGKGKKGNALKLPELRDWKALRAFKPDVAFITNPTSLHLTTAVRCAREGMHLFIEKPLDASLAKLPELLKEIRRRKIATYVAYVLRFHPVIRYLKRELKKGKFCHLRVVTTSYLPTWQPRPDHRKRYSARRSLGGGVIYDLSHELDYVKDLLGGIRSLKGQYGRRGQVTVDAEDYADILVNTPRGPVNIHINFLSHARQRTVQIDFEDRQVTGDLVNFTVSEFRRGKRVKHRKFAGALKDCFRAQLKYFFAHLNDPRMMNWAGEAAELVGVMNAFKSHK